MTRAFIALGANLDPEANLLRAVRLLARRTRILQLSTFYRTAPVDGATGPPFINGMAAVDTELPPRDLKHDVLRAIEHELGRVRTGDKNAPRPIDLDLVHYDQVVVTTPPLVLPDPDIWRRPFLALPLAELAPHLRLAGSGAAIAEVAARLPSNGMQALPALSAELRRLVDE
jgi:2-amino-4-hydroxy-6-hydroxymethyldihydropteridine diphosphokinase